MLAEDLQTTAIQHPCFSIEQHGSSCLAGGQWLRSHSRSLLRPRQSRSWVTASRADGIGPPSTVVSSSDEASGELALCSRSYYAPACRLVGGLVERRQSGFVPRIRQTGSGDSGTRFSSPASKCQSSRLQRSIKLAEVVSFAHGLWSQPQAKSLQTPRTTPG